MLAAAVSLMRVLSCSLGRYKILQSSGMLQRSVHVLRHILAACPATPPVRIITCVRCMSFCSCLCVAVFLAPVAMATGTAYGVVCVLMRCPGPGRPGRREAAEAAC